MRKSETKTVGKINWPTTVLLVIGYITILFPLYMTIVVAFKNPTEVTNDIAGALSSPQRLSLSNFAEAMRVTDSWHSLGDSLFITGTVILLPVIVHSLAGYATSRNAGHSKFRNLTYPYIASGTLVPFATLMMPLVEQTTRLGVTSRVGVILLYIVFYMSINLLLHFRYLKNVPTAPKEAARVDGTSTWCTYWYIIFPIMKPMHTTVAVLTALDTWNDVMTLLIIMPSSDNNALPPAQLAFQNQFGTNYDLVFASYLPVLLPTLVSCLVCRKRVLNGVVNGAVE